MASHHSTLELAKHDETATAPERDHAATAFELDSTRLALEVPPATIPQVSYDTSLPEAQAAFEGHAEKFVRLGPMKQTSRKTWITSIAIATIVGATAIGVGLGVWRSRKHSNGHQSLSKAPRILNDTSLAVALHTNGDRHLFFQDHLGVVRRVVHSASTNQWVTISHNNVTSYAKNHTPLAVSAVKFLDNTPSNAEELFYILQNNTIGASIYRDGFAWETNFPSLQNRSTANNSRQLSIASTSNINVTSGFLPNATAGLALLLYENEEGNVTALLNYAVKCNLSRDICSDRSQYQKIPTTHRWADISTQKSISLSPDALMSTLYEAAPNAWFATPFASALYNRANSTNLEVRMLFYSPTTLHDEAGITSTMYTFWTNDNRGSFSRGVLLNQDHEYQRNFYNSDLRDLGHSGILDSDIALNTAAQSAIFVNNTKPTSIFYYEDGERPSTGAFNYAEPNSSFPFSRLASVTLADKSASFLYHQINETTFAEEQWVASLADWLPPSYFTVPG